MKCPLRLAWCLLFALFLTGCAHVTLPANPPTRHTLRLLARAPEQYTVFIDPAHTYKVGYDGLVSIEVPPLGTGTETYLFGSVKVGSHRAEDIRAIQILKGGLPLKRLSLRQIYELPVDSDGSRLLRM